LRTTLTGACCPRSGVSSDALHHLLAKRRPFLTAKRLLTNQTFRDLFNTDTLDLKGSTALYERVGDLVAYDLVRQHFGVLHEIVAAEAGCASRRSAML
jgi:hypothetical protein